MVSVPTNFALKTVFDFVILEIMALNTASNSNMTGPMDFSEIPPSKLHNVTTVSENQG